VSRSAIARARLVLAEATLAYFEGRWRASDEKLEQAERLLGDGCVGAVAELGIVRLSRFGARLFLGQFAALRPSLDEGLRLAEERGDRFGQVAFRSGYTVLVRLADGDLEGARAQLAFSRTLYPPSLRLYHYAQALYAQVTLALYGGDPRTAWRELRAGWPALGSTHTLRQAWLSVLFWDLRGRTALAAALAGEPRRPLVREVRRAAKKLDGHGGWAAPLALLLRAGLARLDGDGTRAGALFEEAARAAAAADLGLHAAVARRRGGADDGWFTAQRIHDPDRFTQLFAPAPTGNGGRRR
jgi:hypothetical protein